METYSLDQTLTNLKGPAKEQIISQNQWAAVGLDRYHKQSGVRLELELDGGLKQIDLSWDSDFSKATMKERRDMAYHGAVVIAWFLMSVLLEYSYVEQTEIGDGVDYRFMKSVPGDDLNFLANHHFVEISGILEESRTNTLRKRIKEKHSQINSGGKRDEPSSVIVTLFSTPKTVKEVHI